MTAVASPQSASATIVAGEIFASVEIAAAPERVFAALSSAEIVHWWVKPGVFETLEWSGEVRFGGRWRASGLMMSGSPWTLEGEFLVVDPPRKLVHTWRNPATDPLPSTVTYELERIPTGTRLTLRHTGIQSPEAGQGARAGWESSVHRLIQFLAGRGS